MARNSKDKANAKLKQKRPRIGVSSDEEEDDEDEEEDDDDGRESEEADDEADLGDGNHDDDEAYDKEDEDISKRNLPPGTLMMPVMSFSAKHLKTTAIKTVYFLEEPSESTYIDELEPEVSTMIVEKN